MYCYDEKLLWKFIIIMEILINFNKSNMQHILALKNNTLQRKIINYYYNYEIKQKLHDNKKMIASFIWFIDDESPFNLTISLCVCVYLIGVEVTRWQLNVSAFKRSMFLFPSAICRVVETLSSRNLHFALLSANNELAFC